nr:right-handed parallel beta-helix repeat-containing protein [uncultured Flavobacterium sp.]
MKTNFKLLALCAIIAFTGCETSETPLTDNQAAANSQPAISENSSLTAKTNTVTTETALKSAVASAVAGDIIKISGTIYLTSTLQITKNGTASSKITLSGGTLNCSGIPSGNWGIKMLASYWNITNMNITKGNSHGLIFATGGYNYVYNVTATYFQGTGIMIYSGGHHNTISACHSSENYDVATGGQNADGFACSLSGGAGNKFDSCVSTHNSDDGFDLFGNSATVVINNCIATKNGYGTAGNGNGFKLGSSGQNIPHTVTNCSSTNNSAFGYDGNGNRGRITITGSGGSGNAKGLFTRIF